MATYLAEVERTIPPDIVVLRSATRATAEINAFNQINQRLKGVQPVLVEIEEPPRTVVRVL